MKKDGQADILQSHHNPKPDISRVERVVAENGSREQKGSKKAGSD